jgi:phage terminase large subunit-like protein
VPVFTEQRDDGMHYFVFCQAYLAEKSPTIRDGNNAFRAWAEQGLITLGSGPALDLNIVRDDIIEDGARNPGSEVCYDAHYASQLVADLEGHVTMVKIRQGSITQSPAMKELEAAALTGRLHHDGNPVLRYCVGNVIARTDRNGNIAPDREADGKKIDCAVALVNALVRAMLGAETAYANGAGLREL